MTPDPDTFVGVIIIMAILLGFSLLFWVILAWLTGQLSDIKYRVAETANGVFIPQFKDGPLSGWTFFYANADQYDHPVRRYLVATKDPGKAASFSTMDDAVDFIRLIQNKIKLGEEATTNARRRVIHGIDIKKKTRV